MTDEQAQAESQGNAAAAEAEAATAAEVEVQAPVVSDEEKLRLRVAEVTTLTELISTEELQNEISLRRDKLYKAEQDRRIARG